MKCFVLLALCAAVVPPTVAQRVYFGTSHAKGIYVAEFNAKDGTLTEPRLAAAAERPGFIAISPNQKYLFQTGVASYAIQPDGALAPISEQSTGEKGSCHVSVDATGGMLMTAYYSGGGAASWKSNADGSLSTHASLHKHEGSGQHPKRQQKPFGHSIFPNPANTHAYVCDLGIDKVMIYAMDPAAGTLTPAGEAVVPGGAMGPRHMKFNADGSLAYVLNELDLSVSIFKAVEDGQLDFVKTISTLPAGTDKTRMTCAEIRVHPNGRFIYVSNRDLEETGRDSITVFSRFEEGFKRVETTPAQVWIPRNFNLDPSGKWLLVGGQKSKDIAIFKVNPATGKMTFTGNKAPFPGGPICIEFLD